MDPARTQVEFNSRWMSQMTADGLIQLSAHYNVARMLEREDFHKRYTEQRPISIHEFMYPPIQGYDSVVLKADVELGAPIRSLTWSVAISNGLRAGSSGRNHNAAARGH
ncbi:MAG: hypothetical protein U0361_22660 [Nitrospiraceae bacterium]